MSANMEGGKPLLADFNRPAPDGGQPMTMKNHYQMSNRLERRVIGELFINLATLMRRAVEKAAPDDIRVDGEMLLVTAAIIVGHSEDKPLNASKIAEYIELPRTTVLRKLESLLASGIVVKHGNNFLLAPKPAMSPTTPVGVLLRAICAASNELRDVPKSDTKRLPSERNIS